MRYSCLLGDKYKFTTICVHEKFPPAIHYSTQTYQGMSEED